MMLLRSGAPIILAAALAGAVPSAAQDAQKDLTEGVSEATPAAELFMRAYEVFSHPRCSNCHPRDDRPRWGPARQVHGMNVQPGETRSACRVGVEARAGAGACPRHSRPVRQCPEMVERWRCRLSIDVAVGICADARGAQKFVRSPRRPYRPRTLRSRWRPVVHPTGKPANHDP